MEDLQQKLNDLVDKVAILERKSKRSKRTWYNRNLASITFYGYLAATIIGGFSLYFNHTYSVRTFKEYNHQDSLNQAQFIHILNKDSLSELATKKQTLHQDSLNKHQDSINKEQLNYFKNQTQTGVQQLGYFKNQTQTGVEQLRYFKKQTQIADKQLSNAEIIYQEQLIENKPFFIFSSFKIDSTINKLFPSLQCVILNTGKRIAYIRKVSIFFWNPINNVLDLESATLGGEGLIPNGNTLASVLLNPKIELNDQTIILVKLFYEDKLVKGLQPFIFFCRFNTLKPLNSVQIDMEIQNRFLKRIQQAEIVDKKQYLIY